MDNTAASAPQIGLGEADLVVEELVEGGLTRLAAFYYSKVPGDVGPVRSMRASDVGIVAGRRHRRHQRSGRQDDRPGQGRRDHLRPGGLEGLPPRQRPAAPYNLMANLSDVAGAIDQDEERPDDYLPWGDEKDLPKGQPAKTVAASFSGGTRRTGPSARTATSTRTRTPRRRRVPADNVLVLRVKVGDAGYLDPAGNRVPETKFTGKGEAMLFHDGRLVRGTWSKSSLDAPLKLSTRPASSSPPGAPGSSSSRVRRQRHLPVAQPVAGQSPVGGRLPAVFGERLQAGEDEAGRGARALAAAIGPGRSRPTRRPTTSRRRRRERLQHLLVDLPGTEHRPHDVEDVRERRALLLLAVALVAEDRRALLDTIRR